MDPERSRDRRAQYRSRGPKTTLSGALAVLCCDKRTINATAPFAEKYHLVNRDTAVKRLVNRTRLVPDAIEGRRPPNASQSAGRSLAPTRRPDSATLRFNNISNLAPARLMRQADSFDPP